MKKISIFVLALALLGPALTASAEELTETEYNRMMSHTVVVPDTEDDSYTMDDSSMRPSAEDARDWRANHPVPPGVFLRTHAEASTSGDVGPARANASANMDARAALRAKYSDMIMEHARAFGSAEVDKRVEMLKALLARFDSMHQLPADVSAKLKTALTARIADLESLKQKIGDDSAEADTESIADSYRGYLFTVPQAVISAAANRVLTVAGQLENVSPKLSDRIDAAAAAGTDVTALRTALTDMDAKVADAKVEANAALDIIKGLSTDASDAAAREANTAKLKEARDKIVAAREDLQAAYKDAQTIAVGVKGKGEVGGDDHIGPPLKNPVEPPPGDSEAE
jgi:hypothetical protein